MKRNPFIAAAMAAAVIASMPFERMARARRAENRRRVRERGKTGVTYKPNGERECARRVRQIAKGQLTESNGLVREQRNA
ncbi:MAG TPA: hypothetical protein VJ797_15710 [Burkholderiales bacterium]|nr:hypothetical protein [Burkholderiales bacterium]